MLISGLRQQVINIIFKGFKGLTQWSLELLAHYSVTKYEEHGQIGALSIAAAFKELFNLIHILAYVDVF